MEVGSNARQFTVTGLLPEQTYVFKLVSRTAVGWGQEKEALVVTTERRGKGTRSCLPPRLASPPEWTRDEVKAPPLRSERTAALQWVRGDAQQRRLLVLSVPLLRQDFLAALRAELIGSARMA